MSKFSFLYVDNKFHIMRPVNSLKFLCIILSAVSIDSWLTTVVISSA